MTAPAPVDFVPLELVLRDQWVAWRYEHRAGEEKPTKVPYSPVQLGKRASSTDPATWASHELARTYAERAGLDGIGFVVSADDPYTGIDLDHVRDAEIGAIEPWAQAIIARLDSYTEISPSGSGVHIFVKGALPTGGRKKGQVEMYDTARFFTITGNPLAGTPPEIAHRHAEIEAIHLEVFGPQPSPNGQSDPSSTPAMSDDEILERVQAAKNGGKFAPLWNGDTSGYPSASEADAALVAILAFYSRDTVQLDRFFRASGLMRPKWDERHFGDGRTYGEATIESALALVTKHYKAPEAAGAASSLRSMEQPWPDPLEPEAFYGLSGDFVRSVQPYSEADPAALLAHFLSGVGALIGRNVYAVAGDAQHPAKLNVVVVGETSKGRKGSAARAARRPLEAADETFAQRITEGLSSGEGLIWEVRDAITKMERTGRGGERTSALIQTDPGVSDKRLLVIESEFASVLRMVQREGNTLSTVVRRAWDGDELRTLTKNSPATSTGAHIAIVGHVTRDELLRYIDRTELASGFANRFLWFASRRGRLLADGEEVPATIIADLAAGLRPVIEWASVPRRLARDVDASAIWHKVYAELSEGRPGMLGGATNRAEAQVLRLSVTYAALDMSPCIRAEHKAAALAVWRYCDASARWVFGDATGDPSADTILAALRRGGPISRTAISELFGKNVSSSRISGALGILLAAGLAKAERTTGEHGGRPAEMWTSTR